MSFHGKYVCFGLIALPVALFCDVSAQENVTSAVTPDGDIVYYSSADPENLSPAEKEVMDLTKVITEYQEVEEAVERNVGLQDFFTDNPNYYVTTGDFDGLYTWDPETKSIEAAPAEASSGVIAAAFGARLDTGTFLAKLATSLFDQTQEMACQIAVRPTAVEGTVSVGVVSFSANWNIGELCQE